MGGHYLVSKQSFSAKFEGSVPRLSLQIDLMSLSMNYRKRLIKTLILTILPMNYHEQCVTIRFNVQKLCHYLVTMLKCSHSGATKDSSTREPTAAAFLKCVTVQVTSSAKWTF